jgi:hypothetical protein
MAMMVFSRDSFGQSKGFFAEPQSILLFDGQSATDFLVVTPTGNFAVPGPPGSIVEVSSPLPALAPAGDKVASSFRFPVGFVFVPCIKPGCVQPRSAKYKSVMGVYSMRDKAWKLYGDFCFVGSAAFSPDGKKLAFEVTTRPDDPRFNSLPYPDVLMILDLETGQFTPIPDSGASGNGQLSWAPDGRRLAVEHKGHIVLIEIGSWAQKAIAVGTNPSWSPRGDWIAYLADWNETCMLIHPDGTGAKMVLDLGSRTSGWLLFKSGWVFRNGEVWSPDEEKLLLIEGQMDGPKYDVSMLDLASGKVTTKSKNGASVLGWVAEKP